MLKKELRVNENRPQDMGELLTLSDIIDVDCKKVSVVVEFDNP